GVGAKKRVSHQEPGTWKELRLCSGIERQDLVCGATDCRGGRDQLRLDPRVTNALGAKALEDAFVKPVHRPERPGDEVEFVLHDQSGWNGHLPDDIADGIPPEQCAGLSPKGD